MNTVDVASVLDAGRWSRYQKLLIGGTALAIILDGMDNQLLGNVIPALMREWSLPRAAFTGVLAVGPLGMMVGGAVGGILGDRLGRRTALLCSVLAFAVPTLAIATADGVMVLGVLRFLAGLGLGGAMPNAAALASEYTPSLRVHPEKASSVRGDAGDSVHPARRYARRAARGLGAAALRLACAVCRRRRHPAGDCDRALHASAGVAAVPRHKTRAVA